MSSGRPQDQQELSLPRAPREDPWAAGQGFGDPWGSGQEYRTEQQPSQVQPQSSRGRQPDPGFDGDEEYDWYRYLSHGGSAPSRDADSAGLAAGDGASLAGRSGRASRAAGKNRADRGSREERKDKDTVKRKTRRDRKAQAPAAVPLTAGPSEQVEAAYPDETGSRRGIAAPTAFAGPPGDGADTGPPGGFTPAAFAGPARDSADTGPGHGWRTYQDSAPGRPAPRRPAMAARRIRVRSRRTRRRSRRPAMAGCRILARFRDARRPRRPAMTGRRTLARARDRRRCRTLSVRLDTPGKLPARTPARPLHNLGRRARRTGRPPARRTGPRPVRRAGRPRARTLAGIRRISLSRASRRTRTRGAAMNILRT